jgi:hypothetical protein
MKIHVFYEDAYYDFDPSWKREMDILEEYIEIKTFLKKQGVIPHTIIHGSNIWGWEKSYDYHVYTKEPTEREISIIKNLFPSKEYGGNTKVKIFKQK